MARTFCARNDTLVALHLGRAYSCPLSGSASQP